MSSPLNSNGEILDVPALFSIILVLMAVLGAEKIDSCNSGSLIKLKISPYLGLSKIGKSITPLGVVALKWLVSYEYKGRETLGRSAITANENYKVNTFIEAFELRGCGC